MFPGLAVRFWQLGIEMRPFHTQLWAYGIYGGLGAGFGYWLQDVETRQTRYLRETRDRLIDKRRRRAEREGALNPGQGPSDLSAPSIGETSQLGAKVRESAELVSGAVAGAGAGR